MSLTKEDNEQIDFAKSIICKTFMSLRLTRAVGIMALTELLVNAMAQGAPDVATINKASEYWYESIFKEALHTLGPAAMKNYNDLMELERKKPGILDAMAEAANNSASGGVQIRMVSEDEQDDLPGRPFSGAKPPSETRH